MLPALLPRPPPTAGYAMPLAPHNPHACPPMHAPRALHTLYTLSGCDLRCASITLNHPHKQSAAPAETSYMAALASCMSVMHNIM